MTVELNAGERTQSEDDSAERPWLAHYEGGVPATVEIPEVPLYRVLSNAAKEAPDRVAVRMVLKYLPLGLAVQSHMTFHQLDNASGRFAAALVYLGIRKGDRVAIMLPNIPQYVIAYFGVLKAGAIVVNTNPTYTARELGHQLEDSGAKCVVLMSGLVDRFEKVRQRTAVEHVVVADVQDTLVRPLRGIVAKQLRARGMVTDIPKGSGVHRFADLLYRHPPLPSAVDTNPDDTVLFQYTGGTTGMPKAAVLTNRNLVANARQMVTWFTPLEHGRERFMAALPFFHVYGMTVCILAATLAASETIMVPDPRDIGLVLQVMDNEKVTVFPGVPAMFNAFINYPRVGEVDFSAVKACLSAGAPLPPELGRRFEEVTGARLVEGYGLTECSPLVCANPIMGYRKAGSIGVPISNTDLAVVSLEPDNQGRFAELSAGKEGEIVVKGPQVMRGYWSQEEETALTIDSTGALHTGDIGRMDEDGYFYVVDRKKDLIIASGYNIVPREVEDVLYSHPKVMEAAVAGIPDEKRGETVKAYIVLRDGESSTRDEIRAYCKENLAPYKVPTLVEFRDHLPKSQVGKVLRRLLVEEELAKMAEDEAAAS